MSFQLLQTRFKALFLSAVFFGTPTSHMLVSAQATLSIQELEDARATYESELRIHPENQAAQSGEAQVSERLALNARAAGNNELALRILLHGQSCAPDNPQILLDLGILEDEMHLYLDADNVLAHAAEAGLQDPNLLYAIARVKLDLGQLDAAEQKMLAYLTQRPEDASAHYALGRIYRQGIHFDKAAQEFKRSIELQPTQTEAYYQLGDTELQGGNFADAMSNFSTTLQRNPKHAGALVGMGVAYFKQKQYDAAIKPLQQATIAEPDYQPGHYYLGLTLAKLGRQQEAARELEEAGRLADKVNRDSAQRLRIQTPTGAPTQP